MRRIVTEKNAIRFIILFITLIAVLSVYPARVWHRYVPEEASMNETTDVSKRVNDTRFIQQRFTAPYDRIDHVDVMFKGLERGRYLKVSILDEAWDTVFTRFVDLKDVPEDTYVSIPLDTALTVNKQYLLTISGARSTFRLGYRANVNGGSYSGIPSINELYYMDSTVDSFHLDAVYYYRLPLDKRTSLILMFVIAVAGILLSLIPARFGRDRIHTVRQVMAYSLTPVTVCASLALLVCIFPFKMYSRYLPDMAVYGLGVIITALICLYALWKKDAYKDPSLSGETVTEIAPLRKFLMEACIALSLCFCCEYMNASATIFQSLAQRKELIFLLLFLLLTFSSKEVLRWQNALILVAGTAAGAVYRHMKLLPETEKEYDLHNADMTYGVIIAVLLAFIIWNIVYGIYKRSLKGWRLTVSGISALVAAVLAVIFRNGRWWPVVFVVTAAVVVYRYAASAQEDAGGWDRGLWLRLAAGGIRLSFFCSVIYSMLYRAYPAFNTGRFPMIFHTVTVTAEYLTIMVCVSMVMLIYGLFRLEDTEAGAGSLSVILRSLWKELVFFGVSASYLIMTLSRTGFLACGVAVILILAICAGSGMAKNGGKKRQRRGVSVITAFVLMVLSTIVLFTPVFTLQRIVPCIVGEPRLFMMEKFNPQIYGAADTDSSYYMNSSRFVSLFAEKVFGITADAYNKPDDRYNYTPDNVPIYGENGVVLTEYQASIGMTNWYDLIHAEDTSEEDRQFLMQTSPYKKMKKREKKIAKMIESGEYEAPAEQEQAEDPGIMNGDELSSALDSDSMFNGRIFLFKTYLSQMNLTGHEEMGAMLPWGEPAIHAHNTYIQAMYDAGAPAGIIFTLLIILMLITAGVSCRRGKGEDRIILLSFAVLTGFAVAGLSEWVFHLSNPMTFAALITAAPLLIIKRR